MRSFFRRQLVRNDFFGLDSVQGYLEMATWYSTDGGVRFMVNESDRTRADSMLSEISRLENEGYVEVQWEPDSSGGSDKMMLRTISAHLTFSRARNFSPSTDDQGVYNAMLGPGSNL